jgi:cold shock CspA family protein
VNLPLGKYAIVHKKVTFDVAQGPKGPQAENVIPG